MKLSTQLCPVSEKQNSHPNCVVCLVVKIVNCDIECKVPQAKCHITHRVPNKALCTDFQTTFFATEASKARSFRTL